jgi:hypothetical protein
MTLASMSALAVVGVPSAVFTRVDDTRVNLTLPTLPAGTYEIVANNAANISRSTATLVVGNPATIGAGVIESPNAKRVVFDEQRGRLFAVDRAQFQVESYTWNGSAWVAGPVLSVPEVADAALTRSGKDLVILQKYAISVVDAGDLSAPRRTLWSFPNDYSGGAAFNAIGINDQGAALITETYTLGSGGTGLICFDTLREQMTDSPTPFRLHYESQLSHSPGGRFSVTSEFGISPAGPTFVFDSYGAGSTLLGSVVELSTFSYYPTRDIDYAGTRMIEGTYGVRDMQGTLLGTLGPFPGNSPYVYGVLSPGGTRVFKLVEETVGPGRIDVHDLTGTPAPDFPVIGSIPMPARVADPTIYPQFELGTYYMNGQVTRDGKFLILAGPERTAVIDVTGY